MGFCGFSVIYISIEILTEIIHETMRESNALGHVTPTNVAVVALSTFFTVWIFLNYSFKPPGGVYDRKWNLNSQSVSGFVYLFNFFY